MTTVSESSSVEPLVAKEMQKGVVVHLENVSVRYRIPNERITSFKEYVIRRITQRLRYRDLWALQSINLTFQRSEIIGIIGRNGAGKSTLLKVIARVLRPTQGRVIVVGNVAPMLELGAGFHSDLTGRENVYLNATLLGYPHALVAERFHSIVDFAELHDFIDMPIRSYSTGMLARLGFAVTTAFQPDLLLLDEVLAVGDASFQEKCLERLHRFRQNGTCIVLVGHNLESMAKTCTRTLWIDAGSVRMEGPPHEVIPTYREHVLSKKC